jgi:hypothetical protein
MINSLWEQLKDIGILKKYEKADVVGDAKRFRADPAFQRYLDEAQFNIITQLQGLQLGDVDEFQELKRMQMALNGLSDFIDNAIMSEQMKNRATADR